MSTPSLRVRGLVATTALLVVLFAVTVQLRAPWRGHLAKGDQWVTALALRWVRAWDRDGAWASKLALVESPPTAEFAGDKQVYKWGLPGEMLLLHAVARAYGVVSDVALLNRVSLATHLALALVLAVAAFLLARCTWPDGERWWPLVAFHCGAFALLFPPILYWGQNITAQDFTVLPLFVFIVVARWMRATVASRAARGALDAGVATAVFLGAITEFLFWVVVPYLMAARWFATRRDRPRTTDPWLWTLAAPFALAAGFLAAVWVANGQLELLRWRLTSWTTGGAGGAGGFGIFAYVGVRVFLFFMFLTGHVVDAFGPIGVLTLVLAAWKLVPRDRVPGLPPAVRGVLLELLLPCLLFSLLLAHHQAFHTIAAIKYVPFVALCWTVLVPLLVLDARRRRLYGAGYAVVALLAILPFSSNYQRFFPAPEPQWDTEAAFLRETTRPTDTVVSTDTQIELVPPQRIALAERRVMHVNGPVELLQQTAALPDDAIVALYGPPDVQRAFGVADADVVVRDGRSVARFPVGRLRAVMQARRDATFREHLGDVLRGDLRASGGPPRAVVPPLQPPRAPLTMHSTDAQRVWLGAWDRLYWASDSRFHWRASQAKAPSRELAVLGDARYATDWMALWREVPATDPAPLDWGRFVVDLFTRAASGGTTAASTWRGYDVVSLPIGPVPQLLRTRVPPVTDWTAHLVSQDGVPVGVALEPVGAGAPNPPWVVVLFDELAVDVTVPDYLSGEWTVQHD